MKNIIEIKNLTVSIEGKVILENITLDIKQGETLAIMGPNGSGKSTLSNVLMGHPSYNIDSGTILFNGEDITEAKPEDRAKKGMFMVFQTPREIEGLTFGPFLFEAYKSLNLSNGKQNVFSFKTSLENVEKELNIDKAWRDRYLNKGFSGGEKKRAEMLQLNLFKPKFAIFDEVDSGLDVDSLKNIGESISKFKTLETSALIVTHYERILKYLEPDRVIVLHKGKIILEGGKDIVKQIEENGFDSVIKLN